MAFQMDGHHDPRGVAQTLRRLRDNGLRRRRTAGVSRAPAPRTPATSYQRENVTT
jgi:hypothetical protein